MWIVSCYFYRLAICSFINNKKRLPLLHLVKLAKFFTIKPRLL